MNHLEHASNNIDNTEPTPWVEAVVWASKSQEASLKKEVNTTIRKSMRRWADVADFNEAGELVIVPQKLVDAIQANPEYAQKLLQNLEKWWSILTPNEITPLAEALQSVWDLSLVWGIVDWIDTDKVDNEELKNWLQDPEWWEQQQNEIAESDETLDRLERTKKIAKNFDDIYGTDTATTIDEKGRIAIKEKDWSTTSFWLEENGEPHMVCGKFWDRNPSTSPDNFYFVNWNLYLLNNLSDYVDYDQIISKEELWSNWAEVLSIPEDEQNLTNQWKLPSFFQHWGVMLRDAFGHTIDDGNFEQSHMDIFYEFTPREFDNEKYFTDTRWYQVLYNWIWRFYETFNSYVYKPITDAWDTQDNWNHIVISWAHFQYPYPLPKWSQLIISEYPYGSGFYSLPLVFHNNKLKYLKFNKNYYSDESKDKKRDLHEINLFADNWDELLFENIYSDENWDLFWKRLDGWKIPLSRYIDTIKKRTEEIYQDSDLTELNSPTNSSEEVTEKIDEIYIQEYFKWPYNSEVNTIILESEYNWPLRNKVETYYEVSKEASKLMSILNNPDNIKKALIVYEYRVIENAAQRREDWYSYIFKQFDAKYQDILKNIYNDNHAISNPVV